ncbi:MAG TPA: ABC transporter permease [Casimicrobiaceae bacterium]|nr:ABC transporter permease [Casimicrobiaceae bacterium]
MDRDEYRKWLLRAASLLVVLLAWQIVGGNINPIFLSTPTAIAKALGALVGNGELPKALGVSILVVLAGFAAAMLVGVPVGLLMGRFRTFEYLIDPYVNALYVVPRIALIPLIIIWFGLGVPAQIVVVFGTSVFPVLLSTYAGVRNVPNDLIETAHAFGATERQLFHSIIMPASVPFIMSGLRLGIGQAIIGMVVAQMFLGLSGMGFMLTKYGNMFETAYVFVVVLALAALGIVMTEAVKRLEQRYSSWK